MRVVLILLLLSRAAWAQAPGQTRILEENFDGTTYPAGWDQGGSVGTESVVQWRSGLNPSLPPGSGTLQCTNDWEFTYIAIGEGDILPVDLATTTPSFTPRDNLTVGFECYFATRTNYRDEID